MVCLLLQALRWRLTKSAPGLDAFLILTSWIERDVLGLSEATSSSQGSVAEVSGS